MTSQAQAFPEFASTVRPSKNISAVRGFYWSLRLEFWENRWLYVAPVVVAFMWLVGFVFNIKRHILPRLRAAAVSDATNQHSAIMYPYDLAAALIMGAALIVALYYSIEALHGERSDRSILFWKSLPVSDWTAVLAKASIPLLAVPLISFVVTFGTYLAMALISSAALTSSGMSSAMVWHNLSLFQQAWLMLYHLVTVHGLWWAPFYGWALLVSAWARRAPLLWATLPVLAVIALERLTFGTSLLGDILTTRFMGTGAESAMVTTPQHMPLDPVNTYVTPGHFMLEPSLWIGLAIGAAFLFAAVQMRRRQGPV